MGSMVVVWFLIFFFFLTFLGELTLFKSDVRDGQVSNFEMATERPLKSRGAEDWNSFAPINAI